MRAASKSPHGWLRRFGILHFWMWRFHHAKSRRHVVGDVDLRRSVREHHAVDRLRLGGVRGHPGTGAPGRPRHRERPDRGQLFSRIDRRAARGGGAARRHRAARAHPSRRLVLPGLRGLDRAHPGSAPWPPRDGARSARGHRRGLALRRTTPCAAEHLRDDGAGELRGLDDVGADRPVRHRPGQCDRLADLTADQSDRKLANI